MSASSFGLLMIFLTLISIGQVLQKKGLQGGSIPVGSSPVGTIFNIIKAMLRPWVVAGLSLYVVGTVTWLIVLSRVKLSIAYPMMSLSYVMVTLLSALVLKEKIRWKYAVLGLAFIGIGVSFIGLGMG